MNNYIRIAFIQLLDDQVLLLRILMICHLMIEMLLDLSEFILHVHQRIF